jgi:FKBP-type peptidyl-prolyl cis-trans isomerase
MLHYRSTKDPGQRVFSFKIGLGQVIRGWDEGVAQMQLGSHATLIATEDYAYGRSGFPDWGIPPSATLRFEIELLQIQ